MCIQVNIRDFPLENEKPENLRNFYKAEQYFLTCILKKVHGNFSQGLSLNNYLKLYIKLYFKSENLTKKKKYFS